MPRRSKIEECMICEKLPCECGRKVGPTRRKIETVRAPVLMDTKVRVGSEASLQFVSALRALESILHPEELQRYSGVLASPVTHEERRAAWRGRWADGKTEQSTQTGS